MSDSSPKPEHSRFDGAGYMLFVFLCALPALEMNGFGFGIPFTLHSALVCATVGGAIGGVLVCPRPIVAGLIGGLLAGPIGLLAVYYYTQHRKAVWSAEIVAVQCIASLPGYGIGLLLKKAFSESPSPEQQESETRMD